MEQIVVTVLAEILLEQYLRGVVPAEVPAYWPEECLKAMAVAARTYAVYRVAHPVNDMFDLFGDARSQVFAMHRIHPLTDKAVEETRGLYMMRDGKVFLAEYVTYCGREKCPVCELGKGYNNREWGDRLCQNGARKLAEDGMEWRDILQFYYGDDIEIVELR
jgi:peptidoglycan hydrolase-like amidase